jgi:hypothetical protein
LNLEKSSWLLRRLCVTFKHDARIAESQQEGFNTRMMEAPEVK